MRFGRQTFAGMTTGTLAVVESANQRLPKNIAVLLRMRLMAIDAGHRAVQITVAVKMRGLIAEVSDPSIHRIGVVKHRQLERKIVLQRRAWQVRFLAKDILRC